MKEDTKQKLKACTKTIAVNTAKGVLSVIKGLCWFTSKLSEVVSNTAESCNKKLQDSVKTDTDSTIMKK